MPQLQFLKTTPNGNNPIFSNLQRKQKKKEVEQKKIRLQLMLRKKGAVKNRSK